MNTEIKGVIKASMLDWDGKIVDTVYVPRCNFRCPFCHNWKLFEHPEDFDDVEFSEIEKDIKDRSDFLDGVCITGGEPTLYSDMPEFIKRIRELGMKIKLDTNGTNPKMLNKLISEDLLEYVAMDIKAPLDERYEKLAGVKVDLKKVRESIDLLMSSDINYEFRTTVVPGMLSKDDVLDIVKNDIEGAQKYVLQQFVGKNAYSIELRDVKAYDIEIIKEMVNEGGKYVKKMIARGV